MIEVYDRLFVGTERDCFHKRDGWAVVHACKHPCHVNAVGYSGSLSNTHTNYLSEVSKTYEVERCRGMRGLFLRG
jgi:hypothetical protein